MVVIALVGLPGSGKSEVSSFLEKKGFVRIRFGDATDDEIKKRGLPQGEESEKFVREKLREELGMHAYAFLNLSRIKEAKGDVVIDGMMSLEEYEYLKMELPDFVVIAIYAPQPLRCQRLASRKVRPLTAEEVMQRDIHQIEKLNIMGAIGHADYTIVNDGSVEDLQKKIGSILQAIDE